MIKQQWLVTLFTDCIVAAICSAIILTACIVFVAGPGYWLRDFRHVKPLFLL